MYHVDDHMTVTMRPLDDDHEPIIQVECRCAICDRTITTRRIRMGVLNDDDVLFGRIDRQLAWAHVASHGGS